MELTDKDINGTYSTFNCWLIKGLHAALSPSQPPNDRERRHGFHLKRLDIPEADAPVLAAMEANDPSPFGLFVVGRAVGAAILANTAPVALKNLVRADAGLSRNFVTFDPDSTAAQLTFAVRAGDAPARSVTSAAFDLRKIATVDLAKLFAQTDEGASMAVGEFDASNSVGLRLRSGTAVGLGCIEVCDGRQSPRNLTVSIRLTVEGIKLWEETYTGTASSLLKNRTPVFNANEPSSPLCFRLLCNQTSAGAPKSRRGSRAPAFDIDWVGVSAVEGGLRRVGAHAAWGLERLRPTAMTPTKQRFILLLRSYERCFDSDAGLKSDLRQRLTELAIKLAPPPPKPNGRPGKKSAAPETKMWAGSLAAALGPVAEANNVTRQTLGRLFSECE